MNRNKLTKKLQQQASLNVEVKEPEYGIEEAMVAALDEKRIAEENINTREFAIDLLVKGGVDNVGMLARQYATTAVLVIAHEMRHGSSAKARVDAAKAMLDLTKFDKLFQ